MSNKKDIPELPISNINKKYIDDLNQAYNHFFFHYEDSPILIVNTDHIDFAGNMDTCITIRTIVMKENTMYLQGGAGIVADSDPLTEHQETLNKLKALERAVSIAEGSNQ